MSPIDELCPEVQHTAPLATPRNRAVAYASTLAADDYLEETRAALRDADDAVVLHNLAVLRSIVAVAISQLSGSSSGYLADTAETLQ
jgi:hypothetical protein